MLKTRLLTNQGDPLSYVNGAPIAGVTVSFTLVSQDKKKSVSVFDIESGELVTSDKITVTTNGSGEFSTPLWPNSRGESATYYKVECSDNAVKAFFIYVNDAEIACPLSEARAAVNFPAPTDATPFDALLSDINAVLAQATAPVTDIANGLMLYEDKIKLDDLYVYPPTDIRYYMDGQSGRPTYTKWLADQAVFSSNLYKYSIMPDSAFVGLSDMTATVQAAVDAVHASSGKLHFPSGIFLMGGTVYIQKEEKGSGDGMLWRPITLQGVSRHKSAGTGNGGSGATMFYKRNAGAIFSVNLDAAGAGVSILPDGTDWHIFPNFSAADISFLGVPGVQTTAIKGWCCRAILSRLTFSSLWRGWDFYDSDVNGRQSYNDFWNVEDIWADNIGDHVFCHSNADASRFVNIHCESFQASAVGGFKMFSGRGFSITGSLFNWLPSTANYVGRLYGCNQVVLESNHFEENVCATIATVVPTAGMPGDATTSANGFLLENCSGCRISNNEFFNNNSVVIDGVTHVTVPTRPNVYIAGGRNNIVTQNAFRNSRALSYDVADISRYTLVFNNTYQLADNDGGAVKADSFYRDSAAVSSSNYGSIFPSTPILTSDLPLGAIDLPVVLTYPAGYNGTPLTVRVNSADVAKISASGTISTGIITALADDAETTIGNRNYTAAGGKTAVRLAAITSTATGSVNKAVSVEPTYNQTSGNAANYDFRVMRTETAVGSGVQKLLSLGAKEGGNYVEKVGVDNKGIIVVTPTANAAVSGVNVTVKVTPSYTQTGSSAENHDIMVDRSEAGGIGSGTQRLLTLRNGGIDKFSVSNTGIVTVAGSVYSSTYTGLADESSVILQTRNFSEDNTALKLATGTASNTTGNFRGCSVEPVYNQASGGGFNHDFRVMRTETAISSGQQRLITAGTKVAGSYVEKFGVDNAGNVVATSFAGTGSFTAATVPTAAADDSTTAAASTAFVIGQASATTPVVTAIGGSGVIGTSKKYARADHAHPKGDANTLDGFHASQTGAVSSCVTTDANGHVGLGVQPYGWTPRAIDFVNGGALSCFASGTVYISVNAYNDGTNWKYKSASSTAAATMYVSATGGWSVLLAPAGVSPNTAALSSIIAADASGNLTIAGATATKASGTAWANPSDRRLKEDIVPYTRGTDVLKQLKVSEWLFNGKGGTLAGTRGVGVIADEAEQVLPEIVSEYLGKLDAGSEDVPIKKVDPSELFWTMLKAIQELTERVEQLESKQ